MLNWRFADITSSIATTAPAASSLSPGYFLTSWPPSSLIAPQPLQRGLKVVFLHSLERLAEVLSECLLTLTFGFHEDVAQHF